MDHYSLWILLLLGPALLPQWLVQIGQNVPIRTVGPCPHCHTVSLGHTGVVVPEPPSTVKPAQESIVGNNTKIHALPEYISHVVPSTSTGPIVRHHAMQLVGVLRHPTVRYNHLCHVIVVLDIVLHVDIKVHLITKVIS